MTLVSKNKILIVCAAICLGILAKLLFSSSESSELKNYIESRLGISADGGTTLVSLPKISWKEDFKRACVFEPYTPREQAEKTLGFSWSDFEDTDIDYMDAYSTVALVGDGHVVAWANISRKFGTLMAGCVEKSD